MNQLEGAIQLSTTSNTSDIRPEKKINKAILTSLVRNATSILAASLAITAALILAYQLLVPPVFTSYTYVSAARETILRMNVLLQSPYILDPAAEKAGFNLESHDDARSRISANITFRPAPGDNRTDASIFYLNVHDTTAKTARAISDLIISRWREGLTPKLLDKERISSDLERQLQKQEDINKVIEHFDKQVTSYVTPLTNSGEVATPFVSLINQRTELAKRIEDLRYALDGGSMFTVISGPTTPDSARRPIGLTTVILGSFIGSFALVVGIIMLASFWRAVRFAQS